MAKRHKQLIIKVRPVVEWNEGGQCHTVRVPVNGRLEDTGICIYRHGRARWAWTSPAWPCGSEPCGTVREAARQALKSIGYDVQEV